MMLHTKFQGHWSIGSGEEDFLRFLPYMGMAAKLVMHTCQVLGKSKSEIARAPLIFAYNLVMECAEKSGAQV